MTTTTNIDKEESTGTLAEESGAFFQAIGVISGKVQFSKDLEENSAIITIAGKEYQLLYASAKIRAYQALRKVVATDSDLEKIRLIVYPKVIHFPKREDPSQIAFQLVGFDKGTGEGIAAELDDMEFKLSGLWQFIPVCQTPCVSVFRNFSSDRLAYIKQADIAKKVKFMKPSHVPLMWKDATVRPFRFNPKALEEQGKPSFVQVKAKFLVHRNSFGFIEEYADPLDLSPKFLKASKKDKAEVMAAKKRSLKSSLKSNSKLELPTSKSKEDEVQPISKKLKFDMAQLKR